MEPQQRDALEAVIARDSRNAIRALGAAERAVDEGRLNIAKILRAAALASRTRALVLERALAAGGSSVDALIGHAADDAATAAALESVLGDLAAHASAAHVRIAADVAASTSTIMSRGLASLDAARDVPESVVAPFIFGCLECGYAAEGAKPEVCPVCGAFSGEFELFAPFFSSSHERLNRRQPVDVIAMLRDDIVRLEAIAGVPDEVLRARPAPGEWCIKEIAGHIVDIAQLADRRLQTITDPAVQHPPERTPLPWKLLDGQAYDEMPVAALIDLYRQAIAGALLRCQSLTDGQWRQKTDLVSGRVSAVDAGSWLVNHNTAHLAQIQARLASAD